jgi:hypothetical protein
VRAREEELRSLSALHSATKAAAGKRIEGLEGRVGKLLDANRRAVACVCVCGWVFGVQLCVCMLPGVWRCMNWSADARPCLQVHATHTHTTCTHGHVHMRTHKHTAMCPCGRRQLELRRAQDVDGWAADVTALRKALAVVDRKLTQMRLIDRWRGVWGVVGAHGVMGALAAQLVAHANGAHTHTHMHACTHAHSCARTHATRCA